ncbi:hypothetical protein SFRURICE_016194, partial [Spodoptera frugiperda]
MDTTKRFYFTLLIPNTKKNKLGALRYLIYNTRCCPNKLQSIRCEKARAHKHCLFVFAFHHTRNFECTDGAVAGQSHGATLCDPQIVISGLGVMCICHLKVDICNVGFVKDFKSLTANRKLLKANPPLTSVTGDHHGVQCIKGDFCSAAYLAYLVITEIVVMMQKKDYFYSNAHVYQ